MLPLVPVHMSTTASDAPAQAAIDRGLYLYYAYNGEAAGRAFAQAAEREPHLAMAYWGVALADGPDLNTPITEQRFDDAARAVTRGVALEAASPGPWLERRLVESMALRYHGRFADWAADDEAYRRAMLSLAQSSYDENAELLAAEALLEHGGLEWNQGVLASDESQTALKLVSGVLQADPSSVMANHLCIHLYDLAPDRNPARACAQHLDAQNFPPQAEHLAHMPAHYWIETGNYARAIDSSDRAWLLMSQLTTQEPDSKHAEQYAKHDVSVGYSAAMMLGNYATAQRWSQRMSAAFGTSFDAITALRFGKYAAAYEASPAAEFGGVSVRGLAALRLNKIAQAQASAKELRATENASRGYLPQIFRAELAATEGRVNEAQPWIDKARANERADFSGESIPLFPADEALGDILLRLGDNAGAKVAFRAALAAYPNDPRALFGLAQALNAAGDRAQAAATRAAFQKEWEGADTNLGSLP